jgi:hypothetical protein
MTRLEQTPRQLLRQEALDAGGGTPLQAQSSLGDVYEAMSSGYAMRWGMLAERSVPASKLDLLEDHFSLVGKTVDRLDAHTLYVLTIGDFPRFATGGASIDTTFLTNHVEDDITYWIAKHGHTHYDPDREAFRMRFGIVVRDYAGKLLLESPKAQRININEPSVFMRPFVPVSFQFELTRSNEGTNKISYGQTPDGDISVSCTIGKPDMIHEVGIPEDPRVRIVLDEAAGLLIGQQKLLPKPQE